MKYGNIKNEGEKQFRISELYGGVNLKDEKFIDKNELSACKNLWFKNGALRTREGIRAIEDSVIGRYDKYSECILPFKMTGSSVYINGEKRAIAYCVDGDYISYELLRVFFVGSSGRVEETAAIRLQRISSETFYRFANITFFNASATVGGGVYAFVTLNSGSETIYRIYEITENFDDWQELSVSQCYEPIIYMNGRGNKYAEAESGTMFYNAKPTEPETLNMLNPKFKAYYTTDGVSSTFKLPVSNIDANFVECKLYITPTDCLRWYVEPEHDNIILQYGEHTVAFRIDRGKGIFSFTEGYKEFIWPYMSGYGGNNIEITAYKTTTDAWGRIVGSKRCVSYNGRMYFTDNKFNVNEIYSCRKTMPLYFPANAKVAVGDRTAPITALGIVCDKLIAFKPTEIYKINVTVGDAYTPDGIISGARTGFLHNDTLTSTSVHSFIGCDCPDTLRNCSNRLVWLSSVGKVYTLATTTYGKENNIYEVSANISPLLDTYSEGALKKAYAADIDGYYMLMLGAKMAVMDYRIKDFGFPYKYADSKENNGKISWYIWEHPMGNTTVSADKVNKNVLFACNSKNLKHQYIAKLSGNKDSVIEQDENGNMVFREYDVEGSFSTAFTDFESIETLKTINKIHIGLEPTADIKITVSGDENKREVIIRPKTAKYEVTPIVIPIRKTGRLKISLDSKDRFAVGGILINYTPIC